MGISGPVAPGMEVRKPSLRTSYMPEGDVDRPSLYDIGNDWIVYYNREGRPYYHNPKQNKTQWAHPLTGEVVAPAAPAYIRPPNPYVVKAVRVGGASVFFL